MIGLGTVGASLLAACSPLAEDAAAPPPPSNSAAKYLVILIVDACRADYLKYGHLPNIQKLMRNGVYYSDAFSGMLESTTPACHAALGTGSFPKNDGGVIGFYWEDPKSHLPYDSVNLSDPSTATSAVEPDSLERLIASAQAPTIAGQLKSVDPTAKVYTGGGVKFYAADAVGGPAADYITYFWNDGPHLYRPISVPGHELSSKLLNDPALQSTDWFHMTTDTPGLQDKLVVDLALKAIEHERPRIVVLNLGEMDWPVAHLYGGPADSSAVTTLMQNADTQLGRLVEAYKQLGIFNETVFCFMGDHGVLPLQQKVDPSVFTNAIEDAGATLMTHDYHTGAFIWVDDLLKAPAVAANIDAANASGVSGVYYLSAADDRPSYRSTSQTLRRVGPDLDMAYRYLLETMNGVNAAHVVVLYSEQTGTLGNGGQFPWKGDHGGASWSSQAIPLIFSGPGVRQGYRSRFPARLVDLAPTFLHLLGAPASGMDGTSLADALVAPNRRQTASQQTIGKYLRPVAAALKAQSSADLKKLGAAPSTTGNSKPKSIPLNPAY